MKELECSTVYRRFIDNLVSLNLLEMPGIEESLSLAQNKFVSDYNKKVKEILQVLNSYVVKVLFFIRCHDLYSRGDNKGGISLNMGYFEIC